MRPLFTICVLTAMAVLKAGEPANTDALLWDGEESIDRYAAHVKLPANETLRAGGLEVEVVLIPAGDFLMGTPEPLPVDEAKFQRQIALGKWLLAASSGILFLFIAGVIVTAIRQRRRPSYSLARLLIMTVIASTAVLSGVHWSHSRTELEKAQTDYVAATTRFMAAGSDEKPAHRVRLSQPFYMSRFLVTQQEYVLVMGTNPSHAKAILKYPVESVSWRDAQDFCQRLSAMTGRVVRLPTEAEWEFACRAGTGCAYSSGDSAIDLAQVAWFSTNSGHKIMPVGQKTPNKFGLYDMHGSVWQWCSDWYGASYYAQFQANDSAAVVNGGYAPARNPAGPPDDHYKVMRGGAFDTSFWLCRAAYRSWYTPGGADSTIGFRVVVGVEAMVVSR